MPYTTGSHTGPAHGPRDSSPQTSRSVVGFHEVSDRALEEPPSVDGVREALDRSPQASRFVVGVPETHETIGRVSGESGEPPQTVERAHEACGPSEALDLAPEPLWSFDSAYDTSQPSRLSPHPPHSEPARTASSARRAQTAQRRGPAPVPPTFQAFRSALVSQSPALDPGKPGLRVLVAVGALAIAVAAFIVWRSQPSPAPLPPPTPVSSPAPSTTPTAPKVTVHVAGKIRRPGVYLLPSGARVTDAVTAAGGVSRGASTDALNLARRLIDGEQIVVGAPPGTVPQGSPITGPAGGLIDLNTATPDQLEELPGVGEVLAARIAEFRTTHGGFTSIDQLREVSGIGPRTFDGIKPKVRV
ncbi:ComEA family DNA-binding protein [Nonomuraea diastatica]|uniref:ComEA family DNA-binding protein n=1 Tax=Nonomuraea diastatica TaxID=1848329 RepID=A0A4R4WDM2_9ACTN|nr:ComEA family DNA-binding protein [Nonomuraea diastatica]